MCLFKILAFFDALDIIRGVGNTVQLVSSVAKNGKGNDDPRFPEANSIPHGEQFARIYKACEYCMHETYLPDDQVVEEIIAQLKDKRLSYLNIHNAFFNGFYNSCHPAPTDSIDSSAEIYYEWYIAPLLKNKK